MLEWRRNDEASIIRRAPWPFIEAFFRLPSSDHRADKARDTFVSSERLAEILAVKATQIRKDLNYIGVSGRRGMGYAIAGLDAELSRILGLGLMQRTAIVGLTPLGRALLTYPPLRAAGYQMVAVFDGVAHHRSKTVEGVPLYPMKDLAVVVVKENVDLCLLCADESDINQHACTLAAAGVPGILSFGSGRGGVPPNSGGTVFRVLDLVEQLNVLTHRVREITHRH